MRRSRTFVEQRQSDIMSILEERGHVSIAALAEELDVSPLTIRRDLDRLQETAPINRTYGAVSLGSGHDSAELARERAKTAIARAAAALVEDGDSLFINTSSTALEIMSFITAADVTIVTNNGKALQMPLGPTMTVLLTGGEIRVPKWSMCGELALSGIGQVKQASKCFMGCTALSAEGGLTTGSFQEAPVNALMVERSEHHYALADASKLGQTASFQYAPVSSIDVLVTDSTAEKSELTSLRSAGVGDVVVVEPDEK